MAEEDYSLENCKLDVRKYFARLYSALKARELQTIRQIEVVWREGERHNIKYNCVDDLNLTFTNESRIFEEIQNFGVLDFEKLNIDSELFVMEDYDTASDEHLYCYKWLESEEQNIEKEAFSAVTNSNHCVCFVSCAPDDIHRKFSHENDHVISIKNSVDSSSQSSSSAGSNSLSDSENDVTKDGAEEKESNQFLVVSNGCNSTKISIDEVQKLNPTQDWLNHIKGETETEPSQIIDLMEHSAIECS